MACGTARNAGGACRLCAKELDYAHNYQFGYHILLTFTNVGILDPETDTLAETAVSQYTGLNAPVAGYEYLNITSGKPIGDTVKLERWLYFKTGDIFSKVTQAYAQKLDNGYVRFHFALSSENGGTVSIDHLEGAYLSGRARVDAVPCDDYVLVVDIPQSELNENRELYVAFKLDGKYIYWGMAGAELLCE